MKKIKVGVIGVGRVGYFHAHNYKHIPAVNLTGVCDILPQKAKKAARETNCTPFLNFTQMFEKVDAVSIAVPTIWHYKIAKEFLRRKIHVLVEKPITKTVTHAAALLALAQRNGCILQVGHIERFNSAFQAVQSMISAPRFIECHRLGPFDPRVKDIGVVLDLMIHDIDIILGLIKSRIKNIAAVGVNVLTNQEDIANARVVFENNTICNLTASRLTQETMRKIRIFTQDAYISLDYVSQQAVIYRKINHMIYKQKLNIKKENPLKAELLSFINSIKTKKPPMVSGREALEALKIALKITRKINSPSRKQRGNLYTDRPKSYPT
ncbi:MAG: Gfo/Idh/MocA family oxidoreductase [Candidatus Omnitrophota bacterium]